MFGVLAVLYAGVTKVKRPESMGLGGFLVWKKIGSESNLRPTEYV